MALTEKFQHLFQREQERFALAKGRKLDLEDAKAFHMQRLKDWIWPTFVKLSSILMVQAIPPQKETPDTYRFIFNGIAEVAVGVNHDFRYMLYVRNGGEGYKDGFSYFDKLEEMEGEVAALLVTLAVRHSEAII